MSQTTNGIMYNLPVPDDLPLTYQDDAQQVVIVLDADDNPCGVYPNTTRALAYIREWEEAALDGEIPPLHVVPWHNYETNEVEVLIDGQTRYRILATNYRN